MVANGSINYSLPSAKNTQYLTPPRISSKSLEEPEPDYTLDHQEIDYENLSLPELMPGQVLYVGESIPREMVRCIDEIYDYIFVIKYGKAKFVPKGHYDMHHIIGRSMIKGYYAGFRSNFWMDVTYKDLFADLMRYYSHCEDSVAHHVESGHRILNLIPLPYWFHHCEIHAKGRESDYTRPVTIRIRNLSGKLEKHRIENYPQLLLAINIFTIDYANEYGELVVKYNKKINDLKSRKYESTEQYERAKEHIEMCEFIKGEIQLICRIANKLKKRHPELFRIWQLTFQRDYVEA